MYNYIVISLLHVVDQTEKLDKKKREKKCPTVNVYLPDLSSSVCSTAYIHVHVHTLKDCFTACVHPCMHTHTFGVPYMRMHACMHARTHARTHACTHALTHALACPHTPTPLLSFYHRKGIIQVMPLDKAQHDILETPSSLSQLDDNLELD